VYFVPAASWTPAKWMSAPAPPPPAALVPPLAPPPTTSTLATTADGNVMLFSPDVAVNRKYCRVVPGTRLAVAALPPCVIVAAAAKYPTFAWQ